MANQKTFGRRTFFAGLGLAAAAGVAAKIASQSAPAQAVADVTEKPTSDGYRLSEHVKKYYRTTTI